MPIFNVERTISLAIDSILMQNVNFKYEIVIVNDASTDQTLSIINKYARSNGQIKIINLPKNSGNAIAFYHGLKEAKGKYYCVLDGDDYYTVRNKLQKQVDFLESDKEEIYSAVTHKYLRVNEKGEIHDDPQLLFEKEKEFTYLECLAQRFYVHTSTYMYRNKFMGNVPEIFKDPLARGDNPRTFFLLKETKGKVKFLDFVGSVYRYDENGIWSKLNLEQQRNRNLNLLKFWQNNSDSSVEKSIIQTRIDYLLESNVKLNVKNNLKFLPKEFFLQKIRRKAQLYAFKNKEFIFKSLYKSDFLDSFCESIGFSALANEGLIPSSPLATQERNILITIATLTSNGGGVYYEIKDIIRMYKDYRVYLLFTDLDHEESLSDQVIEQLHSFTNLSFAFGSKIPEHRFNKCASVIKEIKPCKVYHYLGHENAIAQTLIQQGFGCKNITIFSFDHGFSFGLSNSSIDYFIVKRPTDYQILQNYYSDRVIYMPCWSEDKIGKNLYKPFNNHTMLITASAAARYYKFESKEEPKYINLIISLLKATKGKHIHYGPIPDNVLSFIKQELEPLGLLDHFINFSWVDSLPKSLYEEKVDIFIEPFPTVSYKITLEVLSAGIPILTKKSHFRVGITDFIYDEPLIFKDQNDFIEILTSLDKNVLKEHSKKSRRYFELNHTYDIIKPYFFSESNFSIPPKINFIDEQIINIDNVVDILDFDYDQWQQQKLANIQEVIPINDVCKHLYNIGDILNFGSSCNGSNYCLSGFSSPEADFVWTDKNKAQLLLIFKQNISANVKLVLKFYVFNSQIIRIYANETKILEIKDQVEVFFEYILDSKVFANNLLNLKFELPQACSPKSLNMNDDQRKLGIALKQMRLFIEQ